MTLDPSASMATDAPSRLGDRIRAIAQHLRQEDEVQIQATARILGAAAQMAQNHDRLIDEVVDMVEDDLVQVETSALAQGYTVEQLKQDFKTLKAAKAHFNLKAKSWEALAEKLKQSSPSGPGYPAKTVPKTPKDVFQDDGTSALVEQRLQGIEQELQAIRTDLKQMTQLMMKILASMP